VEHTKLVASKFSAKEWLKIKWVYPSKLKWAWRKGLTLNHGIFSSNPGRLFGWW
jgi:hypothetical protein